MRISDWSSDVCSSDLLDREVTGFVANRMQMALAREALQMIARGEATVAQVDHALMHGIGPRLAAVGLFGGYILHVEDRDPATWLRPLAAFDFGAELVPDAPFPAWQIGRAAGGAR